MTDLDSAWDDFLQEEQEEQDTAYIPEYLSHEPTYETGDVPKCSDIYISTKTKIAFLSHPLILAACFGESR